MPTMAIAEYTATVWVRARPSGKVTATSDSAVGAAIAAPTPCTARAAISHACPVASPPSSEANEKTSSPAMRIRRRPCRSPALPPSSSSPPNATA